MFAFLLRVHVLQHYNVVIKILLHGYSIYKTFGLQIPSEKHCMLYTNAAHHFLKGNFCNYYPLKMHVSALKVFINN